LKIKVSIYRNNKANITGSNPAGSAKQKSQQTSLIQYLSAYLLVFEKHLFALKLDFLR